MQVQDEALCRDGQSGAAWGWGRGVRALESGAKGFLFGDEDNVLKPTVGRAAYL